MHGVGEVQPSPPRQHEASRRLGVSSRRFSDSLTRLLIRVEAIGTAVKSQTSQLSLHSVALRSALQLLSSPLSLTPSPVSLGLSTVGITGEGVKDW